VLQVRTAERSEVMATLREHGLSKFSHFIGKTRPAADAIAAGKGELQIWRDAKSIFSAKLADLHQGVGCRELEDRTATRQPSLRRCRTRRCRRREALRHACLHAE